MAIDLGLFLVGGALLAFVVAFLPSASGARWVPVVAGVLAVVAVVEGSLAQLRRDGLRGGLVREPLVLIGLGLCLTVAAEALRSAGPGRRLQLLKSWGGATIAYRRRMIDSPSYTLNHEEVAKALEEGIVFAEGLTPTRIEVDKFGHASAVTFQDGIQLPARSVLIAAGTQPNTVLAREEGVGDLTAGEAFGLQAGGQTYRQIVFFQNREAYDNFTSGGFEFDASASGSKSRSGISRSGIVPSASSISGADPPRVASQVRSRLSQGPVSAICTLPDAVATCRTAPSAS